MKLYPLPQLGSALSQCHSGRIGSSEQDTQIMNNQTPMSPGPPSFKGSYLCSQGPPWQMVSEWNIGFGLSGTYILNTIVFSESKIKAQEVQEGKNSISFVNNYFSLTKELS